MDTHEKGIYQFHDQSGYIKPTDPEVIYEREPTRIARSHNVKNIL